MEKNTHGRVLDIYKIRIAIISSINILFVRYKKKLTRQNPGSTKRSESPLSIQPIMLFVKKYTRKNPRFIKKSRSPLLNRFTAHSNVTTCLYLLSTCFNGVRNWLNTRKFSPSHPSKHEKCIPLHGIGVQR